MSTSTFVKSFIKNDLMELATGKKKHNSSSSSPHQYSYPLPEQSWQQQQQQQPSYPSAPQNSYPPPPSQGWHQHPPPPPPPQQPAYYGAQQNHGQAPPPPPYVANPYAQQQYQQPQPPLPPPQHQQQQHQAPVSPYPPSLAPQLQTPGTLTFRPCPTKASLLLVTSAEGQPPAYSVQVRRSGKPKLSLFLGMPSPHGTDLPIATADFSSTGDSSKCHVAHRGGQVQCKQSILSGSFRFEPPASTHGKLKWEPDDWTSKKLHCRKSSGTKVAKAKGGSEMEIMERMDPATVEVMILTMLMARQRQVKDNKIMQEYWEEEGEETATDALGGGDGEIEIIGQVLQALLGG